MSLEDKVGQVFMTYVYGRGARRRRHDGRGRLLRLGSSRARIAVDGRGKQSAVALPTGRTARSITVESP
jgi:hypothetical protein